MLNMMMYKMLHHEDHSAFNSLQVQSVPTPAMETAIDTQSVGQIVIVIAFPG
jgi:hypothetical protein